MGICTLQELIESDAVRGRLVFVRADLNVPLRDGRISDDTRLRASLATLEQLRAAGARIVVASHLGRPKGQYDAALSLQPVAGRLGELLGVPVAFAPDCIGDAAESAAAVLADGDVLLLENLRFHPGETQNEARFAQALARLADVYVNDAFGTAHRAHASTAGIVAYVETSVAGCLLQDELAHLGVVLEPARPLLCLLGGAKVSDKLGVLLALGERADVLCVGGAMAYTFLSAQGRPTGTSRVESDRREDALRILCAAEEANCRLLLPTDHLVAERIEEGAETRIVESIPDGWMGVDIGPDTASAYAAEAADAKTILWNGPMGVFEIDAFSKGTERVAQAVAASPAVSVVGGGDSLAAVNKLGLGDRIGHLSTGGGASLEYVQGLELPGVAALER